ncbi:hypothetical protein [Rhodococcus aetherivorans]|nr:hypothetical protein [Rhodococcus aetherivorans]MDV6295651.1 hypothetical protein [Rhodococcus aetherivorans]
MPSEEATADRRQAGLAGESVFGQLVPIDIVGCGHRVVSLETVAT